MLKYTIKRLITFIPMLIAISLLSFIITLNSPGDPLENQIKTAPYIDINMHPEKETHDGRSSLTPFLIIVFIKLK